MNLKGPDHLGFIERRLSNKYSVDLYSSVLHLRGNTLCNQPFISNRFALCFNGEVFGGLEIPEGKNDVQILGEYCELNVFFKKDFEKLVVSLQGPFSILLYNVLSLKN